MIASGSDVSTCKLYRPSSDLVGTSYRNLSVAEAGLLQVKIKMNDMNPITTELFLKELETETLPSPVAEADIGETIIIEGRYVSVDRNNQEIKPVPDLNVPNRLVGQYA